MKFAEKINRLLRGICYFPQTLYVNFRALPTRQAMRFPIVVMSYCSFRGLKKNSIHIESPVKTGMIKLGAQKSGKSGIPTYNKSRLVFRNNGCITFQGKASFGRGLGVCVDGGEILFGTDFSCNVNCFLASRTSLLFGNDVLLGWNVNIRDDDGHPIYDQMGNEVNQASPVKISEHVWIASYVDILKGVSIAKGIIVGYRSLVTRDLSEEFCIYAGTPPKVVKRDVIWNHNVMQTDNIL